MNGTHDLARCDVMKSIEHTYEEGKGRTPTSKITIKILNWIYFETIADNDLKFLADVWF